jgi:hypothetical protein
MSIHIEDVKSCLFELERLLHHPLFSVLEKYQPDTSDTGTELTLSYLKPFMSMKLHDFLRDLDDNSIDRSDLYNLEFKKFNPFGTLIEIYQYLKE